MKTTLLSLMFTLVFKIVICQNTFQINISDSLANVSASKVISFDDGSFIVPYYQWKNGFSSSRMIKFDKNGNRVWSQQFGKENANVSIACNAALKSGGFITVFYADSINDSKKNFTIAKCDNYGNIEWQKEFIAKNDEGYINVNAVCASADGGFYLLYLMNPYSYYGPFHYYMCKFDKKGKQVWTSKFNVEQNDYGMTARAITETGDGNVVAMINVVSCEAYCTYTVLYVFNKEGSAKACYYPPFENYIGVYPIFTGDNQGRIHIASYNSIDNRTSFFYYTVIETNGNQKGYRIDPNVYTLQKFIQKNNLKILENKPLNNYYLFTNDKGFVNIHTIYKTNKPTSIQIDKSDSLGRVCPLFKDTVAPYHIQSKVSKLPNYQFSSIPVNNKLFSVDASLSSTAAEGNIKYICAGNSSFIQIAQTQSEIITGKAVDDVSIAPNPALNYFTLYLNNNNTESVQMNVTNSNGNILISKKIMMQAGSNKYFVDISYLPAGIYFVQLSNKSYRKTIKLIKE